MLIYLRQANGNGYSVEMDPKSSISKFISCINWENGLNSKDFSIFFKGVMIGSTQKTFQDYGIKQNDILHLVKNSLKNDRETHININIFYNNETYSLRIKNKQNIQKLKVDIYQLIHVNPRQQLLVFNGKRLHESLTLQQEHIENDSLITLIKRKTQINFPSCKQVDFIENDLLNSIASLKLHRKQSQLTKQSKTSLFRSDSFGIKTQQEYTSPEVEVKNLNGFVDLVSSIDSQIQLKKLFTPHSQNRHLNQPLANQKQYKLEKYQLYNSCGLNQQPDFIKEINIKQDNQDQSLGQNEFENQSLYQKLKLDSNSLFQSFEFQHSQIKIKTQHLFCTKQQIRNPNPQLILIP